MGWTRPLVCLLAGLVVLGGLPLGAAGAVGTTTAQQAQNETTNVTAGQQLSTVLAVTSDDVQSEVEETEFELEVKRGDDAARAEALAERAQRLRERAEDIREDYEAATEAYEAGEISQSTYAQRIATLNARANNVVEGYERFEARTDNVSEAELRAAGVNETSVRAAIDDVDSVRGVGADALLQRFTGTASGEFEIETADGVSVEVKGEAGESSREIRRPRDNDTSFTVSQSTALNTSRAALSAPPENGTWALEEASVHNESGYYKFEYGFATANRTGEAEVRVDGSSGEVFRLEEEIELTDAAEERLEEAEEREEEEEEEREDEDGGAYENAVANITVSDGTATVTVTNNGSGLADATVLANDQEVGTTDSDGTLTFDLPDEDDVDVDVLKGEFEAEFEFERQNGTYVQTGGPDGQFEEEETEETEEEETEEEETETAEDEETETEEEETETDEEETDDSDDEETEEDDN